MPGPQGSQIRTAQAARIHLYHQPALRDLRGRNRLHPNSIGARTTTARMVSVISFISCGYTVSLPASISSCIWRSL